MYLSKSLQEYHLDPNATEPKYEQVYQILSSYIMSLPASVRFLPFENDIASQLEVSRRTVRRALEELRKHGMIETSKKSGSRIVRDSLPKAEPQAVSIRGTSTAVLLASDRENPHRNESFRWQLIDAFESRMFAQECGVVVYNLRENNWNPLNNLEKLADSLQENGIRWAVMLTFDRLIESRFPELLLHRQIKPVLFNPDLLHINKIIEYVIPGVDQVMINHTPALSAALNTHFTDVDAIGYITTDSPQHTTWALARAAACRQFAESRGISFRLFQSRMADKRDNEPWSVNPETIEEYLDFIKGKQRPLCIAANDKTADHLMDDLAQRGIKIPEDTMLLGYDNLPEQRARNLSTFDFNPMEIASTLEEMYLEYWNDRPKALSHSTIRITYPRYIARSTA